MTQNLRIVPVLFSFSFDRPGLLGRIGSRVGSARPSFSGGGKPGTKGVGALCLFSGPLRREPGQIERRNQRSRPSFGQHGRIPTKPAKRRPASSHSGKGGPDQYPLSPVDAAFGSRQIHNQVDGRRRPLVPWTGRWSMGEWLVVGLEGWKEDYFAQRGEFQEEHQEAVYSQAVASCRGHAVAEGFEEVLVGDHRLLVPAGTLLPLSLETAALFGRVVQLGVNRSDLD